MVFTSNIMDVSEDLQKGEHFPAAALEKGCFWSRKVEMLATEPIWGTFQKKIGGASRE
jgi:hypothetical protein